MYSSLNVNSKFRDYKIKFCTEINNLKSYIDTPNTVVVLDKNIKILYPELPWGSNIFIDCNENAKTLKGAEDLLRIFIEKKVNIRTKLLVVGGGILQDLVGFCASIYCRGIDYTLIPTTLLAQTDSCVGGKTSINFFDKKNILGTFYPPEEIVICTDFLKTLHNTDLLSGLGEIYKFHILQNKIESFNITGDYNIMIYESLKYKIDILSRDEFDKGERKFLNYGHTFGHALESTSKYEIPHGLAVVIGCMIATKTAQKLGYKTNNPDIVFSKGVHLIEKSKINLKKIWFDANALITAAKSDKKSTGKITMVLVDEKPFLENIENLDIINSAIKEVYESI